MMSAPALIGRPTPQAAESVLRRYQGPEGPINFSREILGHDPWSTPEEIMRAVAQPHARVAVKACHSSSKCVAASSLLTLADGTRVRAADLIDRDFDLLTITPDGVRAVAAHASFNAIEPVYEIITESGRRITRNGDHPLWAAQVDRRAGNRTRVYPSGWTRMGDLRADGPTHVAVPESLPAYGQQDMPEHEIKALAYLLGDGGYTGSGVVFTQQDNAQLQDFREAVQACGAHLAPTGHYGYRVVGDVGVSRQRSSLSPSGVITHRVNPVLDLLRVHGMMGVHSRDKRVPDAIFALPYDSLCLFLSRLFATDGWATCKGAAPEIAYCSASRGLVEDLQELLLRFGVCARVWPIPGVRAWKLAVNTASDVLTFCDHIGIFGKEGAVATVRARAAEMVGHKQLRRWRNKKCPSGLRWERVQSITPAGIEATVAIEVPEHHTYLSTFWEHNSFSAAELALWWTCAMGGMTLTTAPTWQQVSRILWGYIKKFHAHSRFPLGGTLRQHELRYAPDRFIIGLSTNEGVRFQGYHGSVLIILDEAPGIMAEIWESVDSIRAGGDVRVLAQGNPLLSSGPFYDAFTSQRESWTTFTIDAFDTPNLQGLVPEDLRAMEPPDLDYAPRPYLATRRWVKEKLQDWGEESGVWMSRVRGAFPPQAPDSLLSLAWLEAAQHRRPPRELIAEPYYAGVDVAGPGEDETVLCVRRGAHILALQAWSLDDARGAVTAALLPYRERRITVTVDAVGIGYHLATHLVDQGYTVRFFNAQGAPRNRDKFRNAKAEEYWGLRERFEAGHVSGLKDEKALGQLGGIRYRQTSRGQIEIEPKDEARKRGVNSPDRAEAVMLAFAGLGAGQQQPLAGGTLGMSTTPAPQALPVPPAQPQLSTRTPVGAPLAGGTPVAPRMPRRG